MKIAVLSDIHSNLQALEAVIASLSTYDELVCLGDMVGYGPQPNEVVEKVQRLHPAAVLMGNHDNAVVTGDVTDFSAHAATAIEWTRREINGANREYLAHLSSSGRLEREGTPLAMLAMFHGSPRDPLSEYIYPGAPEALYRRLMGIAGAKVTLLGHTHVPMSYRLNGNVLANPGSVGQPRDGDCRASYAILSISESEIAIEVKRVEYDIESVANQIVRKGLPTFLAERLYIGM